MDFLEYRGLEWGPCDRCGDGILKSMWGHNDRWCYSCSKEISAEPWMQSHVYYRAVRPDEILTDGLCPKDPTAEACLEFHVTSGSSRDTQFVSMTSEPLVALFFAIKGVIQRNDAQARVVRVEVLRDCSGAPDSFIDAYEYPDFFQAFAPNYARRFREVCFEGSLRAIHIKRVFTLDRAVVRNNFGWVDVQSYDAFLDALDWMVVAAAPNQSFRQLLGQPKNPVYALTIHTLIVGCRHYRRALVEAGIVAGVVDVALAPEPQNIHDNDAIRVDIIFQDQRMQLGYLPREINHSLRGFVLRADPVAWNSRDNEFRLSVVATSQDEEAVYELKGAMWDVRVDTSSIQVEHFE